VTIPLRNRLNSGFSAACADRLALSAVSSKHHLRPIEESSSHNPGAADNAAHTPSVSSARGFSMLELIIVIAIMMIVAGIAVEFVQRAAQTMRLEESAINYSNLLQQARLSAVHDDKYYTVLTASGGVNGNMAFVDIAGTGIYVPGEPMMVFSTGVSPQSFGSGPNLANLEAQFLPNNPGAVQTVNTTALGPTLGSRGLPCTPTGGPLGTCPYLSVGGVPTSYITFFQNTQSGNWEAVTLTPAGRIRQWRYDGSTWSSLN
jgi:prepilin-type N-terminal cleavage/methylation domain-containing protein